MDKDLIVNGNTANRSRKIARKMTAPGDMTRLQRERAHIATSNARRIMAERLPDAVRVLLDALTHEHSLEHKHDCYWFQVRSTEMILKRFIPELQSIQATVQAVEQPNITLRWVGLDAIAAKEAETVKEIGEAGLAEPEGPKRHDA